MSNMISYSRHRSLLFLYILILCFAAGCSGKTTDTAVPSSQPQKLRDNTPKILATDAPGETVFGNETVTIDASGLSGGYIVLTYLGTNEKVKFQIAAPDEVTYTYLVANYKEPIVYPLTGGNGTYLFSLLESVDAKKDLYAIAFSQEAEVSVTDEFLPYLTPNVYSFFDSSSASVLKGTELAKECYSDLEVIENIYHFVTQTITYDEAKARSVTYGYIPNPDETLSCGTGICFDYASLMTAMLRSQQIPTKLEVGYAGEAYHAWISCYVEEVGWIDNIIEFNGESWSLMDPTLAANNSRSAVQEYIGDGSRYIVKYTY
mgnify:CR=1 FL=1